MEPFSVVILGATGAVGSRVALSLQRMPEVQRVTVLSRRLVPDFSGPKIEQHMVDVLNPQSYRHLLRGQRAAVCTFGVGQPSKVTAAEFVRVDKDAVLAFAKACKESGVEHFELLGSLGADARSRISYLRTKGELRDALVELHFERLSVFQPSMILTPTNRYGIVQGWMLAIRPLLDVLFAGRWKKNRGIPVEKLGAAMAVNLVSRGAGVELLHWTDFVRLAALELRSLKEVPHDPAGSTITR